MPSFHDCKLAANLNLQTLDFRTTNDMLTQINVIWFHGGFPLTY